ncbi:hypothetical protein IEQ11_14690 [Lysobacter capsici]|uniref:hypothetical protein n=1 Tax=Lysobacter capsici TaxID=435897 RepID=UPI00177EE624|nr:hypothetical protein [Lysobacter capsici]UOF13007.1 hypothetical protein IEQ11_14690 [Lysobacter capsici]
MPITLYRGDSRPPDPLNPADPPTAANSIRGAGGFQPWVITPLATGREVINRCIVPRGPVPALPPPADQTSLQALLTTSNVSLIDVLRNIKAEKTRRTIHLSTDTTIDSGGYPTGYVYQMQFNLNVQALGQGAVTAVNADTQLASATKANVFFDGATLATSTLFGISGGPVNPGVEAAFLTVIPMAYITHYCIPGKADAGSATRPWIAF